MQSNSYWVVCYAPLLQVGDVLDAIPEEVTQFINIKGLLVDLIDFIIGEPISISKQILSLIFLGPSFASSWSWGVNMPRYRCYAYINVNVNHAPPRLTQGILMEKEFYLSESVELSLLESPPKISIFLPFL